LWVVGSADVLFDSDGFEEFPGDFCCELGALVGDYELWESIVR